MRSILLSPLVAGCLETIGSSDLILHEVELSGNNRCQQIEINSYPDSPLFISTGSRPQVSSKRLN